MNAGKYERLVFSCWITLLACGTVREAMWCMKIKTLTSWAGDFTCEAESLGRQILLHFNEILDTTPRVSLLEKLHLRLITAERLWADTCSQHVASRAGKLAALEAALVGSGGRQLLWLSHQSCSAVALAASELWEGSEAFTMRREEWQSCCPSPGTALCQPSAPQLPWSAMGGGVEP